MGNILHDKAYGIDLPIQLLQTWLYENLYVMFGESGLTAATFNMYGRTYRNNAREVNGYVPEAFISGVDYSGDLFHNDELALLMWFGVNDPTKVKGAAHTYNVTLYVFCNLDMVKPNNPAQRMDEEVIQTIRNLILPNKYGFYVQNVIRDVDNVLKRFSGDGKARAITDNNLHPKLCFAIEMTNTIDSLAYQNCDLPLIKPKYFNAVTGSITVIFKDDPSPTRKQLLVNGVKIPIEYPTGTTLTIPHLSGRYVFPDVDLDGNNMSLVPESVNYMAYTPSSTTFTYGTDAESGFQNGSVMIITYNENN
jgi:hypothetical protein